MSDESAFASSLDHLPCGILSFNDASTIEQVNATLLDMLGRSRGELIGQHVETILTVGSRVFYQTHLFPLVRMHGRAEEIFLLLKPTVGEDIGVLCNIVRRQVEDAAVYDAVLLRVRERRKYEDELLRARRSAEEARAEAERANRAKSDFFAVMSHELRTPLNAIGGYTELLAMGVPDAVTDQQRAMLERVKRSQAHLLGLINGVLDLSKLEAGGIEYAIERVALADVVDYVVPMVEPQIAENAIDFDVRLPGDLAALADQDKVRQILVNLLSNAIKFTPARGDISLHGERRNASVDGPANVSLSVRDTGIGIAPDMQPMVFEAFVQVAAPGTAPNARGSGLGLAISRRFARGMGGDLTVVSSPGEGSTFTLTLPAA